MSTETAHPCFQAPENPDALIWRYMDFTKFVAMLDTGGLYFARSDRFDDPYEGATSHANPALRERVYQDQPIPPEIAKQISSFNQWVRHWTYLNCWHLNDHESAAMWKLYGVTHESIAIRSAFAKLQAALAGGDVFLGLVRYIDYQTDWLPEGNAFWPFVHKRKSFEHEREVRGVIQNLPKQNDQIPIGLPNPEQGCIITVDLNLLIDHVTISPTAPLWFVDLVQHTVERFGYQFKISQSSLTQQPIY